MANANILFNKRIRVGQTSIIDRLKLIIPQHWLIRVGKTSILTDSSGSNLNIDRLELVKPQHWPTWVGQTSTLTDSSWSNLNIDRLELVKPQHWPTRVGQTSTSTDASWSNFFYPPPPPPITYPWSHPCIHLGASGKHRRIGGEAFPPPRSYVGAPNIFNKILHYIYFKHFQFIKLLQGSHLHLPMTTICICK